jgi:type I restriction enzyme M protein
MNVNPTNLIPATLARQYWRGTTSGLKAWDVLTPNRASSNIGEFAIILPGEEAVVLTKEMYIIRVIDETMFDAFYFLWALSLKVVREQWRRIALMQTNREDCGDRHKEIILPLPPNKDWADEKSGSFRTYFSTIAKAKESFLKSIGSDERDYIASVTALTSSDESEEST